MQRSPLLTAMALFAAPSAFGQIVYDAGTPGQPATAPSPTMQGWAESITGTCNVADVSPDPNFPVNAWQINDSGSGRVRYERNYFPGQSLYEVEVVMRPLAGTVYLEIDSGNLLTDNVFELTLELVGNEIEVSTVNGGPVIVCPGAADGYHSYHFLSGPHWQIAEVRYDGVYLGTIGITGLGLSQPGEGIRIGTLAGPAGRVRLHRFSMDILRERPIGTSYCGPAVCHAGGVPARMEAFGYPYWFLNNVRISAVDLPPHRPGYFLVSSTQDFVMQPGASLGNLCLGGSIGRYSQSVQSSGSAGTFSLNVDLTSLPTSPMSSVMVGDRWNFQAWFRDVHLGGTSNFTSGLAIDF